MFYNLPWLLIRFGIQSMPVPKNPEITHGEFPFQLEYEINGQIILVEDILVCEYLGVGTDEGRGKYRMWDKHLVSGSDQIVLLEVSNPVGKKSTSQILSQIIYYDPGPANYYMGDKDKGTIYKHMFPDAYFYEQYEDGSTVQGRIYADDLYSKFNIKMLDWNYAQPIENIFP